MQNVYSSSVHPSVNENKMHLCRLFLISSHSVDPSEMSLDLEKVLTTCYTYYNVFLNNFGYHGQLVSIYSTLLIPKWSSKSAESAPWTAKSKASTIRVTKTSPVIWVTEASSKAATPAESSRCYTSNKQSL